MKSAVSLIALFFVLVTSQIVLADTSTQKLGIYLNADKIGYSIYKHIPLDAGFSTSIESKMKLKVLGYESELNVSVDGTSDINNRPVKYHYKVDSMGSVTNIDAKYNLETIECNIDAQGTKSTKTIVIPPKAILTDDSTFGVVTGENELIIGKSFNFYTFNPISISLDLITATVISEEKIQSYMGIANTYKLSIKDPRMTSTIWVTKNGELLLVKTPMGLEMKAEKSDSIEPASYTPPQDLALATTIEADKSLPNPRNIKNLTVEFSDLPEGTKIPNDNRQKATKTKNGIKIVITTQSFESENAVSLPIKDTKLSEYLSSSEYMPVNDPIIQAKAKELMGETFNSYNIAISITNWVHKTIKPSAEISVMRSAVDIMKDTKGVCRDYSILAATLGRAAGVPTRICSGVVYFNSRFYYHAWVEFYTGQWVAFDPTFGIFPVDATHIKLSSGNLEQSLQFTFLLGAKARIIRFD